MKTRQQMVDLGYTVDPSAAVMHFLTAQLSDKDVSDLRRQIPRKDLVEAWRDIEDHAKELAKRLMGKEAATPSRTWNLLSVGASRDGSVSRGDGAAAGGGAEDQELLHQVARRAEAHSAAGDDGTPDHAAVAGVSQDCARCIHAAARRKTAFADRDFEVLEAVRAAATAATSATPARTWTESGRCGAAPVAEAPGKPAKGKGKKAAAAAAAAGYCAGDRQGKTRSQVGSRQQSKASQSAGKPAKPARKAASAKHPPKKATAKKAAKKKSPYEEGQEALDFAMPSQFLNPSSLNQAYNKAMRRLVAIAVFLVLAASVPLEAQRGGGPRISWRAWRIFRTR